MEQENRKYPVGIQTFSEIIRKGYIYVDKTDIIWKLAHDAKYIFLSRPRRFGKSLLTSTLDSYFRGEKDLFAGLGITNLEKDWKPYPVIHIDLSIAKGKGTSNDLARALNLMLGRLDEYLDVSEEVTPGEKLDGMINRLYKTTGNQVVVLIDEYDAPLLDVLHDKSTLDDMRRVMQEFYQPLKANEAIIQFCFITGITKFSQLSIFSTINNLTNVTLAPEYSAICGITERELCTTLWQDVQRLADTFHTSAEAMHQRLKQRYDGYHFSEDSPEIYNPFSLLKAFQRRKISNWWFESGTPTFLIRQMKHFHTDITSLDHLVVPETAFDQPTENMQNALPLLYQSGYLTIKDYDPDTLTYTLAIPNEEVRVGYVRGLLPVYIGIDDADVQMGFALKFWKALRDDDINLAMEHMQAYLAGIPYVEGFKKKLAEAATAEGFYEYTMYLIFSMLNVYVRTQVKTSRGRADMVVFMPNAIYVIEIKAVGTADDALKQIKDKGYAEPYNADGRKLVLVGVSFDKKKRTVDDWIISEEKQ